MRATRAIIHLENLKHNITEIKKLIPENTKICIPVKADAYGHGALRTAVTALRSKVFMLAVATVTEGIELREAGIVAPILSLSIPIPEEIPEIFEHNLTSLVVDEDFIKELGKKAKKENKIVPVHLKIDTGMGRIGCDTSEALDLARIITKEKHLKLEGCASHLAVADSCTNEDIHYTKKQIESFVEICENLKKHGINPGIRHIANSGAILQHPESILDMVRPGILVYGYLPDPCLKGVINVKPVMELSTQLVSIKKIKKGSPVSYGRIWTASEDTYIGTIPVGYADGLNRKLSPGLKVKIGENEYPIVGKICMDQCMINLGPDPWVERWDTVTIFGPKPAACSAENLAQQIETIPYEITCEINKRVPRLYIGDDA